MARVTQGCFSLLADLTDTQIEAQIKYCITNGWAVSIEWTDDPHPRNCYWEMWGLPLFDIPDVATVMYELNECRKAHPGIYIKICAFMIQRPSFEPGCYLVRQEAQGRNIVYTMQSYAVQSAGEGARY